ncbi:bifunctional Delta(1)-pyrroline-2-carboxylate/Delta(1)-piperideine-2-carboxylate reductase [Trinickia fusca]|uniref:Delta(1)-pyrroline-2-carboxylate reductase family protein n=1 Tax=Trinickia fusca TaxID=2419777 RepID=A0A494WZ98_9BURK|nr:bifunctional Delta(1)-pyrroline-2-carboxylate/Delta(1)-piperideine-2-carboxylate reductase [Trinickia fusca]RKP43858.1 delta(1)-pyrroline-2-carboxylate reductase family protein [Trinickia fusca]
MTTVQLFDAQATARLTPYPPLVDALERACIESVQGAIASPARLVVPLNDGAVMLSMPAAAHDLAIHKLVTVCPKNRERALPTIHGLVNVSDPDTGQLLFALDGPTVTGRRTAAVTLLAIRTFAPAAPRHVLLVGTGTQAAHHVEALAAVYPDARILVQGSSPRRAAEFCAAQASIAHVEPFVGEMATASIDVVVTLTTSRAAVYDEPARRDRLVVGVGAFTPEMVEIGARTIAGSWLYVDDFEGARHEAGDFIQAGVDWARVTPLAGAIEAREAGRRAEHAVAWPPAMPVVVKSVGCAAWDLAACRVARAALSA